MRSPRTGRRNRRDERCANPPAAKPVRIALYRLLGRDTCPADHRLDLLVAITEVAQHFARMLPDVRCRCWLALLEAVDENRAVHRFDHAMSRIVHFDECSRRAHL